MKLTKIVFYENTELAIEEKTDSKSESVYKISITKDNKKQILKNLSKDDLISLSKMILERDGNPKWREQINQREMFDRLNKEHKEKYGDIPSSGYSG